MIGVYGRVAPLSLMIVCRLKDETVEQRTSTEQSQMAELEHDGPVGQDHVNENHPEPAPVRDLPPDVRGRQWPSWARITVLLLGTAGVVAAVWYFNTRLEAKVERLEAKMESLINAQKRYLTELNLL